MTTYYLTTDILKTGKIQEVQATIPEGLKTHILTDDNQYIKLGKDAHTTRGEARVRTALLVNRKIAFFQKQIDKLNSLNFEE